MQTFYIKTFGCQQNTADSQRIASYFLARGYKEAKSIKSAGEIVINTCMVRQSAEDRVTGLVKNLVKKNRKSHKKKPALPAGRPKIILTGCMVGMITRDESGEYLRALRRRLPEIDEFLPLEEVGFSYPALRGDISHAWVPISNGCNNFCTYCVVPFTRGREISRPFDDILGEIRNLAKRGCKEVTFLGQNVNSYGADIIKSKIPTSLKLRGAIKNPHFTKVTRGNQKSKFYTLPNGEKVKPVMVKYLGKYRIPTLFPYLLEEVCKVKDIKTVKFISSNPWDFSNQLIEVIAKNPKIDRNIHLPSQSGDSKVLKRMNRWYTPREYINLINKIKAKIKGAQISTDIIVGFPGETKEQFQNTVRLAKAADFAYAYVSKYSPRPNTAASKAFTDSVPYAEKERRFRILNQLINSKRSPRAAVH